jgi:bisphosphoglycerate-dependent phosphoglycerate mutase
MSGALPVVYLARHGDTAWTQSGQHTGLIDLPLTEDGERHARQLGERLKGMTFDKVFTSPLQRAARTCELGDLERPRKSILTLWSGTTANMRGWYWPRF